MDMPTEASIGAIQGAIYPPGALNQGRKAEPTLKERSSIDFSIIDLNSAGRGPHADQHM